jgi:hypothetical protein
MMPLAVQHVRHGRAAQPSMPPLWHFGCNPSRRRHFVKAVARCALSVATLILMASVLVSPQVVTSTQPARPAVTLTVAATDGPSERSAQQGADGIVDLYGNEVIDAIATYSLDPAGSLYELHSPQTELPRLGSPKS